MDESSHLPKMMLDHKSRESGLLKESACGRAGGTMSIHNWMMHIVVMATPSVDCSVVAVSIAAMAVAAHGLGTREHGDLEVVLLGPGSSRLQGGVELQGVRNVIQLSHGPPLAVACSLERKGPSLPALSRSLGWLEGVMVKMLVV